MAPVSLANSPWSSQSPGRAMTPVRAVASRRRAPEKSGARKNTHATFTKAKVRHQRTGLGMRFSRSPSNRSATWARPWSRPQNKNVHPAPCQKPLTRKMMRMLT